MKSKVKSGLSFNELAGLLCKQLNFSFSEALTHFQIVCHTKLNIRKLRADLIY